MQGSYSIVYHSTVRYSTVQYSTVQWPFIQIQYDTVQCSTLRDLGVSWALWPLSRGRGDRQKPASRTTCWARGRHQLRLCGMRTALQCAPHSLERRISGGGIGGAMEGGRCEVCVILMMELLSWGGGVMRAGGHGMPSHGLTCHEYEKGYYGISRDMLSMHMCVMSGLFLTPHPCCY